jgi:hypothetical protein
MITLILLILLLLLIPYLGIGLTIYYLGTRDKKSPRTIIHRSANQRLAFKNEILEAQLRVSASGMPKPEVKSEPWHIVLVIDKSGSMASLSGIYHAREAAWNLVASTPADFVYSLVEFEAFARISCHFTADKNIVKEALDKIECTGATSIHDGLKVAFELIKDAAPPMKNTAVILMSDGGSDKQAAVLQAQNLHEAAVPIFTVGLGQCDKELLREVAGDPLRFFYADEPSRLKYFFHMLGRKIRSDCAHDVEVTEYPNISAAPLQLAGWGDLLPLEAGGLFNREEPMVKWFLTGLDLEASSIRYRLKPRKCGWFPVAHRKAHISMKNSQEQEFSHESNPGPYVLVIPRFLMWQVFWIFLNPLFWRFKRYVCGETSYESLENDWKDKDPKLTSLPTAGPQVIPVPEPIYAIDVDPTLAIGIGYGGIYALTHLKRFLWEHNQDDLVARKVVFIGLDTVKPDFTEILCSGPVHLEETERKNIQFQSSEELRSQGQTGRRNYGYSWLEPGELNAEGIDYETVNGTGANPRVGRLILLQNQDKIEDFSPVIQRLHRSDPSRPLNICIAAALGGGTSTGMLLDLCYFLKQITHQLKIPQKSISLFLMEAEPDPDEPDREKKQELYKNNKEALIRQLARFFATRNSAFSPGPGYEAIPQWFDHVFWSRKKADYHNHNDLYPQTGAAMYEWITEKSLRDYIRHQSQYAATSLLVHSFRTEGLFLYKRLLEQYYAVKLVFNILGRSVLGFVPEVSVFSIENCTRDDKAVTAVIMILLEKEEWAAARPQLLRESQLITRPDSINLSRFLARGGFPRINESSSVDETENVLRRETNAFAALLFSWLEFIMATHQDRNNEPVKEYKLPTAYFALLYLKEVIGKLEGFARGISPDESLADRKQCLVLIQMSDRFARVLDQWLTVLKTWSEIIGEGTQAYTGLCRRLHDRLGSLEKMLKAAAAIKKPLFRIDDNLLEKIYKKYFHQLETDILDSIYWNLEAGGVLKMGLSGIDSPEVYNHDLGPERFDNLFRQLTALPGGFAARHNQWHRFSIDDFLELSTLSGEQLEQEHLVPKIKETTAESLCFMSRISFEHLQEEIPTGVSHHTVESDNPLVRGFFQFELNHEVFTCGDDADFAELPPFIFDEEWNCYNALSIYRRMTKKRIQSPPFSLVALCRDLKKFLGAVKYGIIDNHIKPAKGGIRMLYRIDTLKDIPGTGKALKEIPGTGNDEEDILKLIALVIDADDTPTLETLGRSFQELLELDHDSLETGIIKSPLPFSESLKNHLHRIVYGGVEYYKHLKLN